MKAIVLTLIAASLTFAQSTVPTTEYKLRRIAIAIRSHPDSSHVPGKLKFYEADSAATDYAITVRAPNKLKVPIELILPDTTGSVNQILYLINDSTFAFKDEAGESGPSLLIREVDLSPSATPDSFEVDQTDGLVLSAPTATRLRLDLSGVPEASLISTVMVEGENISLLTNDSGYLTGNETITLSGDATGSGATSIVVTVVDDSHNHIITNIDAFTEAQLETQLSDVANVFTGNDGALADDDLSDDNLSALADVTISAVATANLIVRNVGNTAFENVAMSGDVSITAAGVTAVDDDSHNHTTTTISGLAATDVTSGTFIHERGGLEADVSAYNGLIRINGGTTTNVTDLSGLNIAISASIVDGAHTTDTGDEVAVDGGATTDPDFVSTDDIDFINTVNTITAAINAGVIVNADVNASAGIVYSKLAFSNDIAAGDIAADAIGTAELNDAADTPAQNDFVRIPATTSQVVYHTEQEVADDLEDNLSYTDITTGTVADGNVAATIHRDSEIKDGDNVDFDDADANFTATNVDDALSELDDVNGSGPNATDGKVEWSQLTGVPAGFADGTDDGTGGGGDNVSVDGGATIDPDFVSTDDIDFINTANTITAALNAGVIVNADVNASAAIDISKTALVAGTSLTLATNTLNVDDDFVSNAGDAITGNLDFSDGSGDSPQVIFTPQTGAAWSIFAVDVDDDLQIQVNTANPEVIDISNIGAGVVNVNLDGTLDAVTLTEGTNAITNNADALGGDLAGNLPNPTVNDDSHNHVITNIDAFTEVQLETQLSDVSNVFTNNDGALADDDLSDDTFDALSQTTDPGADRIVFWDDSDTQHEYLTAGTGLTILVNDLTVDLGTSISTAEIDNGAVDNTKIADMAQNTIKMRVAAGSGDPEDIDISAGLPLVTADAGDFLIIENDLDGSLARVDASDFLGGGAETDPTLTDDAAVTVGDGTSGNVTLTFDGDAGTDGTLVYDVSGDGFVMSIPGAVLADGDLSNGSISFAADATNNILLVKGKDSAGDVINGSFLPSAGSAGDVIRKNSTTEGDYVLESLGSGTGSLVGENSPVLLGTPTIADLTNIQHDHTTVAEGGTITIAALTDIVSATESAGHFLVRDAGNNSYDNVAMSGDATLAATGAVTIASNAVGSSEITDGSVTRDDVESELRSDEKSFYIEGPTSTTEIHLGWKPEYAITITQISAYTDQGTWTFNVEHRAETTPNTVGTDVMTADLVADTDQQENGSFADATIPLDRWLVLTGSAETGTPNFVAGSIRFTVD